MVLFKQSRSLTIKFSFKKYFIGIAKLYICSHYQNFLTFYAPFEEEWVYCFTNVGLSVCRSVDEMVSAD